jgi:hypothetical protein
MKLEIKLFYHVTSIGNLITILKEKVLIPKGERINGYDEDTISFSDILNDYATFYGNAIIEFVAKQLIRKNEIYPYKYDVDENSKDFYDMPFWETEWRGKQVKFDYNDINKIYFLDVPLLSISKLLHENGVKFKIISEKDLPSFSESYFMEKYRERMKIYHHIWCEHTSHWRVSNEKV